MNGQRHRRRLIANAVLGVAVSLLAVLYFAPPGQASFWPACPIHQLFGIDCPGCGATRALAALLHGHLRQALGFNALFVVLLPVALAGCAQCYHRALQPCPYRWPNPPRFAIGSVAAASIVFTIARNIAR